MQVSLAMPPAQHPLDVIARGNIEPRIFAKVEMTKWAYLPIILTLGIFILIQNYRLRKAYENLDADMAISAIRWGGDVHISLKAAEILQAINRNNENQVNFIRFYAAQIDFNNWKTNPDALEFIAARDDHQKEQEATLLAIVPNAIVPKTTLWEIVRETLNTNYDIFEVSSRTYFRIVHPHIPQELANRNAYQENSWSGNSQITINKIYRDSVERVFRVQYK